MYKLVIVDDDENVLEGLCTAVRWDTLGFEVIGAAKNGIEALNILQKQSCDALLTDIRMGQMNGLELIEKVHETNNIPVVVMSAYEDFHYARKAVSLGVVEYIVKPIDLMQLHEAMGKVYRRIEQNSQRNQIKKRQDSEKNGQMTMEDAQKAESGLNTRLLDHLVKMILLGNVKETESDSRKLAVHVKELCNGSCLFIITVFVRISSLLERDSNLTDRAKEILSEAKGKLYSCASGELCLEMMSTVFCNIAETINSTSNTPDGLMYRAKQYVDKNYKNPELRVKDVAKYVGISTNYFSSMFSQCYGESFSDYLIRLRISESCVLLKKTNMKTYEIAAAVGYDNAAYFSAAFKKYTGMSVSDFRSHIK